MFFSRVALKIFILLVIIYQVWCDKWLGIIVPESARQLVAAQSSDTVSSFVHGKHGRERPRLPSGVHRVVHCFKNRSARFTWYRRNFRESEHIWPFISSFSHFIYLMLGSCMFVTINSLISTRFRMLREINYPYAAIVQFQFAKVCLSEIRRKISNAVHKFKFNLMLS